MNEWMEGKVSGNLRVIGDCKVRVMRIWNGFNRELKIICIYN